MTETKQMTEMSAEEALEEVAGSLKDFVNDNYIVDPEGCFKQYCDIIRTELRELREKCENWEIAARVKAFDDHFPDLPEVHTLQLTREEALRWFTKGMEATEEGGRSFEQLWCEKQQDQEPDVVRKLSLMLVTLCRTLPKEHAFRVSALEYLAEQNLMPSPLRDGGEG